MWRPRDPTEGRGEQINESGEGNMTDTQKSSTMSPELARITELAKEDKQRKFFSIAHLLTIDALYAAFLSLRTEASDRERSEEHTSELQSRGHLVCRLLLEKKKT